MKEILSLQDVWNNSIILPWKSRHEITVRLDTWNTSYLVTSVLKGENIGGFTESLDDAKKMFPFSIEEIIFDCNKTWISSNDVDNVITSFVGIIIQLVWETQKEHWIYIAKWQDVNYKILSVKPIKIH